MKSLRYIFAFAAATLAFSCTEPDPTPTPDPGKDPEKPTPPPAESYDVDVKPAGPAEDAEWGFIEGDSFTVINETTKTIDGQGDWSATYTLSSKGWAADKTLTWEEGKNTFKAWAPASSAYDKFEIPKDQTSPEKIHATDWMLALAKDVEKPEDNVLNLQFEHQLSKVTVKIDKFYNPYTGEETIESATIHRAGKLSKPNLTTTKVVNAYISDHTMTAIMAPGTYKAGSTLATITLNSTPNDVVLEQELVLEAGKAYEIAVTVGTVLIEVEPVSVTVVDWKETNRNPVTAYPEN